MENIFGHVTKKPKKKPKECIQKNGYILFCTEKNLHSISFLKIFWNMVHLSRFFLYIFHFTQDTYFIGPSHLKDILNKSVYEHKQNRIRNQIPHYDTFYTLAIIIKREAKLKAAATGHEIIELHEYKTSSNAGTT